MPSSRTGRFDGREEAMNTALVPAQTRNNSSQRSQAHDETSSSSIRKVVGIEHTSSAVAPLACLMSRGRCAQCGQHRLNVSGAMLAQRVITSLRLDLSGSRSAPVTGRTKVRDNQPVADCKRVSSRRDKDFVGSSWWAFSGAVNAHAVAIADRGSSGCDVDGYV